MAYPSTLDFLESFGIEPTEVDSSIAMSRYLVKSGTSGVVFDFSFSEIMNSFQVSMCLGNQVLATLSSEGVETIDIFHDPQADGIRIRFNIDNSLAHARLTLSPDINLHWSILCNT
ncbi:hypothetical protein [Pseudomonas aegrilactucae]|uniref:Uncharacterized protein n=1 Tax=Pseudomonas aegrilactucae TaxID=2854028 RepID=A0A9Q2XLG0_9PSED|nr:hypothetical protein [Pseudomonas aegrilactucae]MBV6288535.1 hypothetical protein [Pseudomonas aegrilactucae]